MQYRATRPLYRSLSKGGRGMKIPTWRAGQICQGLSDAAAKPLLKAGWVTVVKEKEAANGAARPE